MNEVHQKQDGLWRLVGLVTIFVSENHIASIFKVERIRDTGTELAVG
jgi:hypothetical protein